MPRHSRNYFGGNRESVLIRDAFSVPELRGRGRQTPRSSPPAGCERVLGAGVFGFMINPSIALYFMQGLNTTPVRKIAIDYIIAARRSLKGTNLVSPGVESPRV